MLTEMEREDIVKTLDQASEAISAAIEILSGLDQYDGVDPRDYVTALSRVQYDLWSEVSAQADRSAANL